MPAIRVSWRSVTCHDEFTQEGAKSAKRAEKTSKEAAAHALPAARASREEEDHEISETNIALKRTLFLFLRSRGPPTVGRRPTLTEGP